MERFLTRRYANAAGLLACVGLIAYALYAQYVLLLNPCPLCLFQRFAIMGLGGVFLIALIHNPDRTGARVYGVLQLVAAGCAIAIAARHIWIQAQPEGSVPACGATLDYLFDIMSFTDVLAKVFTGSGECAKIDWQFLGLSMPWWVVISAGVLGLWGVATNWMLRR